MQLQSGKNNHIALSDLQTLPKTDLHVHLDGSMRLNTLLELSKEQGCYSSDIQEQVLLGKQSESLVDVLKAFQNTTKVMQTKDALKRIAYELAEDAHKENVWYMEVRFAPMLHTQKGLREVEAVEAVSEGLQKAENNFGIATNIILCGIRNFNPKTSLKTAQLAVDTKSLGVVGFDLAGPEFGYPALDHVKAFELARKNNLHLTVHAGEDYGPKSIKQAIHDCGARRIGHGLRLREDEELLHFVNDNRIPLEVCLSSNVQTKSITKASLHPLKEYLQRDLIVTINTDNRLISNTTVSKELHLCQRELDLTYEDVGKLLMNGFKAAFLPWDYKKEMLYRAEREICFLTK